MDDHRDTHSPDIALLIVLARIVRGLCQGPGSAENRAVLDEAMKPFESGEWTPE
jgi:hypothetical protein